jgi:hypothetical protein
VARYIAAVVAVLALAGCASRTVTTTPGRLPTAAELSGIVSVRGAARLSEAFIGSTGPHGTPTCAAAAKSGNAPIVFHRFVVATGSGGRIYAGPMANSYRGPGAYADATVRMDDLAVVIDRASVDFRRTAHSTLTMTVRSDASGAASFVDYEANDGRRISGMIQWTCRTKVVI